MKRQNKKPLCIMFDANPLVANSKSGVGYYTKGLIESLADNYPNELQLTGHYFNFLGRKKTNDLPQRVNISYRRTVFFPTKLVSAMRKLGIQLPIELFTRARSDINLFTNFVSNPSIFHTPTVVTIHDLGYIEAPEYVSIPNLKFLKSYVPRSVKMARKVFAISRSTRNALIQHYGINKDKVTITAIPPLLPSVTMAENPVEGEYILFLGTIEPRKNIVNLLAAYMELPKETRARYSLVLAGGKGWKDEAIKQTLDSLKNENIITTGYISDDTKAALYQNASVFVLPSHYEGFGMPVLEAMSYSLPVILSDIGVFHEVAGDAAIYVDKDRPQDISKAILSVLTNDSVRKEMVKKSRERVSTFSWQKVAETVYSEFLEIIGPR